MTINARILMNKRNGIPEEEITAKQMQQNYTDKQRFIRQLITSLLKITLAHSPAYYACDQSDMQ